MLKETEIYRDKLIEGFDGATCRIFPGIMYDGKDRAFVIHSNLSLTGSDVFLAPEISASTDGGHTFSAPRHLSVYEKIEDGIRTIFGIDSSVYHKNTNSWLCFGRTTHYADDKHPIAKCGVGLCEPYFSILDPEKMELGDIAPIKLPFETISAVPFGQPIVYEDGNLLLTFYGATPDDPRARAYSMLYAFDGENLELIKSGTPIVSDAGHLRGFCEPSMACLDGKYYMTIRTDDAAYLAVSDDGLEFNTPIPWVFDDGAKIESRNTQQRWVRFDDTLYLVYTRETQYNGHVFRNRAPLFMSQFDPERLCLIRESERILVPEMGARLGNFQVTDVSGSEAWVNVAEWMQLGGINKDEWKHCVRYGSNNTVWRVRVVKK